MKFKYHLLYSALFLPSLALAQTQEAFLDDVQVIAELEKIKANDNLKTEANLSLLGKQPAFTSPISVVHYDENAFANKEPRNVVDALAKTDASVMNFGGETNTLQGIYVRGLQLDARQFSVNGLAGLYSTYNSPTAGIASAQLIKGASTATVGMDPEGSSGASVNIETKRATDEPINKISLAWFSNSRLQESFDLGRRFGENNEWGIRVSGNYRDGNTARHHFDEMNQEWAIGADYRGEKWRAGVDYLFTKRATHGGRARVQDIQNLTYALPDAPNGKMNLIPHWSGQTTRDETVMGTFEYDITSSLMLSGGLGQMASRYFGAFGQITANRAGTGISQDGSSYRIAQMRGIDYINRTTSGNVKLRGDFYTSSISHNWNIALDSVTRERDFDQTSPMSAFNAGSIYAPHFSQTALNVGELVQGNTDQKIQSYSVAFADMLGFYDDRGRLTVGGRFQWVKQQNFRTKNGGKTVAANVKADRFSPMIAGSYSLNPNFVLYANYLEDLEPGSIDADSGTMENPVVSRQLETGVRKNWNENLTTTFSVYEIARPGIIRGTAGTAEWNARKGKEQGKERNRGVEFNLYTKHFDGTLRSFFGFSYNQGKLIDYPSFADVIINGEQVASPRIMAKAGVEWDTYFARDITLNAGVQYYGKSYQDAAKNFAFPSYTTVDLGVKYVVKFSGNQTMTLRGAVENVFNENYWQVQRGKYDRSFAVVGMPRTFWTKAEYTF